MAGGFGGGFGPGFGPGFGDAGGPDTTPDAFLIAQRTNMPVSTVVPSAPFTVTGIDAASTWSISAGGEISINGGAWVSAGGTVDNNDVIQVRVTSSVDPATTVSTTLTIGGVDGVYMVITRAEGVFTAFPPKGGNVLPPRGASKMVWARSLARRKNRARRVAAQG